MSDHGSSLQKEHEPRFTWNILLGFLSFNLVLFLAFGFRNSRFSFAFILSSIIPTLVLSNFSLCSNEKTQTFIQIMCTVKLALYRARAFPCEYAPLFFDRFSHSNWERERADTTVLLSIAQRYLHGSQLTSFYSYVVFLWVYFSFLYRF